MKIRFFFLTTVMLLAMQLSAFAQKAVDDRFLDGVQEYTSRQFAKALALFDKVVASEPDNDAAWYYKGLSHMYLNQSKEGLESLRKAVALDPSNYWYRDRLALTYNAVGERDAARNEYEALVRDFPKKIDVYFTLVNMYIEENELDKAVSAITSIENLQGKNDGTVMTKYQILLHQQKQDEALESLKDYVREYSSPQVLSMLADHEVGMYNDSLAIAYYDEALALDSSYSPARLGKAEVYRMTRKYPEYFSIIKDLMSDDEIVAGAKADYLTQLMQHIDGKFVQTHRDQLDSAFDIMLAHHPADTAAISTGGIYYFSTGRQEKARDIFRAGKERNPDDRHTTLYYLQVLSSMNDYRTMVDECEAAEKRFPGEGFDEMAIYGLYNLGDYQKVIAKSESIIAKAPKDSAACLQAYSTIGDCHHLLGDDQKSYKAYEKALKINPRYAPVLNNYAYYLATEGKKLGKAYKMSRITVELEPDNSTYLDTFGWILHLLRKDIEAKPFFKHAMLYGGKESATVLAHYAIVLETLGETDLANVYKAQAKAKAEEGAE